MMGKLVNDLGAAYWAARRFQDAIYCHQEAAGSFWKIGDRYGQATALNDLGNAYRAIDQTDDAIASHHRAIEAFTEIGDRHGVGQAHANLSLARQQAGDVNGARQAVICAFCQFLNAGLRIC
jgi:tetratricopeptide (TPR) repeat protein